MERLDSMRPSLITIAEATALGVGDASDVMPTAGVIPVAFFERWIVKFVVGPSQRWLDLRSPQTIEVLRNELASQLANLGYRDRFVHGDLLSHEHKATRLIAGWAINHNFDGIAYASCHDPSLTCWALFEGARIEAVGSAQPVSRDDPDLLAVAKLWNLTIPG